MVSKNSKHQAAEAKRTKPGLRRSPRFAGVVNSVNTPSPKKDPLLELYAKHPLPDARNIRVLEIQSSDDAGGPVKATMRVTKLPASRSKTNHLQTVGYEPANGDYQCLSYVWGTSAQTQSITVDGHEVLVTPNLEEGLKRFRNEASAFHNYFSMTIWVDALCIDQSNLTERSQQVAMMGEIYTHAQAVLIWLGEASDRDLAGLQSSSRMRKTAALEKMVSVPWFQRRWIIQETLTGNLENRWFIYGALESIRASTLMSDLRHYLDTETLDSVPLLAHRVFRTVRNGHYGPDVELLTNLLRHRNAQCQEPLDRIYALLGISRDGETVPVDYSTKSKDIYLRLAKNWLAHCKSPIAVLVCASVTSGPRDGDDGLPSWVPNWQHVKLLQNDHHRMAIRAGEMLVNIAAYDALPLAKEGVEIDDTGALVVQGWVFQPYCYRTETSVLCTCCAPAAVPTPSSDITPTLNRRTKTTACGLKREWPPLKGDEMILHIRLARFGFVVKSIAKDEYAVSSCFLALPDAADPTLLIPMTDSLEAVSPSGPIRIV